MSHSVLATLLVHDGQVTRACSVTGITQSNDRETLSFNVFAKSYCMLSKGLNPKKQFFWNSEVVCDCLSCYSFQDQIL